MNEPPSQRCESDLLPEPEKLNEQIGQMKKQDFAAFLLGLNPDIIELFATTTQRITQQAVILNRLVLEQYKQIQNINMCLEQMEVRTKQMENLNAHQKRKRNSQMQLGPHFFHLMDESATKQRHIDHKRREKATQKRDEIENKILYQTRIKKGKMDQLLNQERMRSMSQQLDSSSQF